MKHMASARSLAALLIATSMLGCGGQAKPKQAYPPPAPGFVRVFFDVEDDGDPISIEIPERYTKKLDQQNMVSKSWFLEANVDDQLRLLYVKKCPPDLRDAFMNGIGLIAGRAGTEKLEGSNMTGLISNMSFKTGTTKLPSKRIDAMLFLGDSAFEMVWKGETNDIQSIREEIKHCVKTIVPADTD